eukprot:1493970-Lingulodinium_polyedra.AAC.1
MGESSNTESEKIPVLVAKPRPSGARSSDQCCTTEAAGAHRSPAWARSSSDGLRYVVTSSSTKTAARSWLRSARRQARAVH